MLIDGRHRWISAACMFFLKQCLLLTPTLKGVSLLFSIDELNFILWSVVMVWNFDPLQSLEELELSWSPGCLFQLLISFMKQCLLLVLLVKLTWQEWAWWAPVLIVWNFQLFLFVSRSAWNTPCNMDWLLLSLFCSFSECQWGFPFSGFFPGSFKLTLKGVNQLFDTEELSFIHFNDLIVWNFKPLQFFMEKFVVYFYLDFKKTLVLLLWLVELVSTNCCCLQLRFLRNMWFESVVCAGSHSGVTCFAEMFEMIWLWASYTWECPDDVIEWNFLPLPRRFCFCLRWFIDWFVS